MSGKFPITLRGAELRKELQRLKTIDRPAVIAAIAEARSHGDLSENAEYDAAKERQGFHRGPHQRGRGQARQCADHRSGIARCRWSRRLRRHRGTGRHG
jgi:hypothetical protein